MATSGIVFMDTCFDRAIRWRPLEPKPSGRTVIVEIDDCSIEHFRSLGEGGWPWSRQRHADLLDSLDRAGVRAVGFDVTFAEASKQDPAGDAMLEEMAEGGSGRFLFASSRLHPDFAAVELRGTRRRRDQCLRSTRRVRADHPRLVRTAGR